MGLQTGGELGPGWYNDYLRTGYRSVGGNPQAHLALIRGDLQRILTHFLQAPRDAIVFFIEKNATQWNDPTFQGLWINQLLAKYNETSLPRFAETLLSPACQTLLTRLGSYFTTLIYGGLLLWAWIPSSEKRRSGGTCWPLSLLEDSYFIPFGRQNPSIPCPISQQFSPWQCRVTGG